MTHIDLRNVETLIRHGAQIPQEDGFRKPLTVQMVLDAIEYCKAVRCMAVCYELVMPGIAEQMAIGIWASGHIDSGSMAGVMECMEQSEW